jgi:RHS repeat-associated protein
MKTTVVHSLAEAARRLFGLRKARPAPGAQRFGPGLRSLAEAVLEARYMPGDTLGGFFITALGLLPVRNPWAEADVLDSLASSRTWPAQDRETATFGRAARLDGLQATGWQPLFSWLSETADPSGFASSWPVPGTATKGDTGWPGPLPAAGLSGDRTQQTEEWAALLFAFGDTLADRPGQAQSHPLAALESAAAGPEVATLATALSLEKDAGAVFGAPPGDTAYAPAASGAGYSLSLAARWDAGPRFAGRPSGNLGLSNSGQPLPAPETSPAAPPAPGHAVTPETQAQVSQALSQTPLMFEANVGQVDPQVQFLTHGPGYTAFLTATEAVLVLPAPRPATAAHTPGPKPLPLPDRLPEPTATTATTPPDVVRSQLLGSNPAARAVGQDQLETRTNYFIGNDPAHWYTDIPNYGRVVYADVYPGVDLVYHGSSGQQLEYDFDVAPGTDPGVIQLAVAGAKGLRLDEQGQLVVATSGAELVEHAPGIYQEIDGVRRAVPGRYVLAGGNRVGFQVVAYDRSRPLVIDPSLSYSTYLGGSGEDHGTSIAVDAAGNAYVTGYTNSTNFPTTPGSLQGTLGGTSITNAFVTKLNASGTALVYSTYLGGSGSGGSGDYGYSIAVDPSGNAYVTGSTYSTNFPTTAGALQLSLRGYENAFVTKLNAAGTALVYSTYLGGTSTDFSSGIAVDPSGNAYVTGSTYSSNFPTTTGALQSSNRGLSHSNSNAFVTKLNASGTALVYSTYLGGSGSAVLSGDSATGIAVDASGNAYVTGSTYSTDFPTANPVQAASTGRADAFVAKLSADGARLVYSTYLGGNGDDFGLGIAVDTAGNAYVTGQTASTNFPTVNPLQMTLGTSPSLGGYNAFVTKLNASGTALVYSTYLGGSGRDSGRGIAVDAAGNAYVTGGTNSTDFPTAKPVQQASADGSGYGSAFVTKLNASGATLAYSTYLGADDGGAAGGQGIAVDAAGSAYLTGSTQSSHFPVLAAVQNSTQTQFWIPHAFITKLNPFNGIPAVPPTFDSSNARDEASELIKTVPGARGGNPEASGFSEAAIRYFDGTVQLMTSDLQSTGFGTRWGQDRSWTNNGPGYSSNTFNGLGWVDLQLPYLAQQIPYETDVDTVIVVSTGTNARSFRWGEFVNQPSFFLGDQLYRSEPGEFCLQDAAGDQIGFSDFQAPQPPKQQGQFDSFTDPYGNVTRVVSRNADGSPREVQRSATSGATTITESYLYSYLPASDPNAGLLSNVTLRRQVNGGAWMIVRQVDYAYYNGTQPYGNLGDLKTATIKDGATPTPNVLDTKYYRYYQFGEANGFYHGLKYAFNPQSYARLVAAVGDPTTASDTAVAPYADNYFEYDSQQRVTREVVQGAGSSASGGLGNYTYSYVTSTNPTDFNKWKVRTTETLPDGNQNIVYTNGYGEVMLKVFKDVVNTGNSWLTFYKYDNNGRLILKSAPSAVTGYDDTKPDLLNYNSQTGLYQYLNNTVGVILVNDFYSSTTATETIAGGVAGYQQDTKIRQGQQGTAILQSNVQYFAHSVNVSANSLTVAPVATSSVYRNTDGTGEEKTQYAYTWFPGTLQQQSTTVTMPTISTAQNGPGTADVDTTFYDTYGRPVWHKDADGYIDYTAYDQATSAVVKTITDVDYSKLSTDEQTSFNVTGWSHPTGGLHLVRTMQVDGLGRAMQETDPLLHVTYTIYDDPTHQARVYPGWNSGSSLPTGPTQVVREVRPAASSQNPFFFETLTMSAVPNLTNGVPDGTESIGSLQTLSRTITNNAGQVTEADAYRDLSNLTYSTASIQLGMAGVNYYATQYAYDQRGRRYRVLAPTGTITRTDYDSLSRVSDVQVGTSDANLVMVSQNVYDQDQPNGVGDSNLTQTTAFPGGGAPNRVTQFFYDWRDRQVASKSGVGAMVANEDLVTHRPIRVTTYDNLGEAIQQQSYDGDQATVNVTTDASGNTTVSLLVNGMPVTNRLRAQSAASYDDQGRVYQTRTYSVGQTDGTVSSNFLATNVWYSHRGQVLKTAAPGGLVSKTQYDGARRPVVRYTTDASGDLTWADASTVASNNVLEQTETQYDPAGNPILTTTRQRFHNETATGALGTPTTAPKARVSYVAAYYDAANRLTDTVDVGTNGGAAYIRPATPPGRSDTVLRTTYGYNSAGWVSLVTDPRNIQAQTTYDNLGRTTQTIEAYTDGTPTPNTNRTTQYTYDGDGNLLTRTALLSATQAQTTQYVYDGGVASLVKSFDLLTKIQYPDKNSGSPSTASADQESFTYNALGETASFTDRNQTTHTYTYDVLGRRTADAVTITRADVDTAVQRLETAYDTGGRPSRFTSFSAASGGSLINQVQETYNGLSQLTSEAQSHIGPVVAATPKVQYAYSEMAGGANHSRLVSMTYPNTAPVRVLSENYGTTGSLDDRISRLTSLSDGSGTLESYTYLGLGDVVQRSYPQPQVNLTYITPGGSGDGGDQYTGLDRFGRVVDQHWVNTGTDTDRFLSGYDRNANRQYRTNEVNHTFDELYRANGVVDTYDGSGNLVATAYDRLNQLGQFARGALNAAKDTIASPFRSQSWSLDALGNWSSVSTNGTAQTRGHNQQNQITSISGQGTPTYDNNGNTTTDETGKTLVFDAWNRLVDVKNGSVVVAAYAFDALGRRIQQTLNVTTDLYYSTAGQVLEEQEPQLVGPPLVRAQEVWSPVYVDALVERDRDATGSGTLSERLYVQQDANYNTTALLNTSGVVVERYAEDPYGLTLVLNPDFSQRGSSAVNWVYLHQGGRFEFATGLYWFRNRDLSSTLGRWMEVDPKSYGAGDNNLYRDEGNQPTNVTDPSGMDWPWNWRSWQDVYGINAFTVPYWWIKEWNANREGRKLDAKLEEYYQKRYEKGADDPVSMIMRAKTATGSAWELQTAAADPAGGVRWNRRMGDVVTMANVGMMWDAGAGTWVSSSGNRFVFEATAGKWKNVKTGKYASAAEEAAIKTSAIGGKIRALPGARAATYGTGQELAGRAKDLYKYLNRAEKDASTIGVTRVKINVELKEVVSINAGALPQAVAKIKRAVEQKGGIFRQAGGQHSHPDTFLYAEYSKTEGFEAIGVSHYRGPCRSCELYFDKRGFGDVYWDKTWIP